MHLHGWPDLRTRSLAIHLARKFRAYLSRRPADSDLGPTGYASVGCSLSCVESAAGGPPAVENFRFH